MENSESRIAPSPEAASDDFASPLNLPPPGPPGRLAFEPVPLRYREDGLTPEKQRAYVEALADCGIAREAAARVGLSEQAINRVRRRADARSFDAACEAAHLHGARRIRSVAWERAIEGTVRGRYYRGELVAEERVFDNRLLTYLYGKVAHLLEPSRESLLIRDRWEEHMDALEQGLEAPAPPKPERPEFSGYEVREDDDGVWWTSFPPPAGFDGEEQGEFGDDYYKRTLSAAEQALVDAQLDEEEAEYRAKEIARRDRFFGFAGGEDSSSREAETCETSEPSDPDPRPIEYKSAVRPAAPLAPSAAVRTVRAEARRRGGALRFPLSYTAPPATAGRDLEFGFAARTPEAQPPPRLRASARTRIRHSARAQPGDAANLSPAPRIP
uniref:Uncharacterized protein n=1 Tax=uncultured bacterium P8N7 TaxID=1748287 RepID=A0A0U3UW62_9BACT|nr:hypothetical protein [uncultured bacterium P8N7]